MPGDVYIIPSRDSPAYKNLFKADSLVAYRVNENYEAYQHYHITKAVSVYDETFDIRYNLHICPIEFSYDTVRDKIYTPDTSVVVLKRKSKNVRMRCINYFDYSGLQLSSFNKKDSINNVSDKVISTTLH
jgi:hypothetical protein